MNDFEKNKLTVKTVLEHLEKEKAEMSSQIALLAANILIPRLEILIGPGNKVVKKHYDFLLKTLRSLVSTSGGSVHLYLKLTDREIQVCNLIKEGKTSRQVSKELSISISTVKKHRESIRGKLSISNSKINLVAFLNEKQYCIASE